MEKKKIFILHTTRSEPGLDAMCPAEVFIAIGKTYFQVLSRSLNDDDIVTMTFLSIKNTEE